MSDVSVFDAAAKTAPTGCITLQSLLWPEHGISTERDVYMRLQGDAVWSDQPDEIWINEGGVAEFNTAFNMFNLGKWQRHCALEDLRLVLEGAGRFELVVFQAIDGRSWERLVNRIVTLQQGVPVEADLSHFARTDLNCVCFFSLRALQDGGRLWNASWVSAQAPRRLPRLAASITTFRREAAVRTSVARFEAFMAQTPLAPWLHLLVVDNGQSAGITPSAHVTPVLNENLGGSGGFSRGLIEAERRGATHCLFMDDDASIHMPAIERTWAFLAYATDPATAVAGGLLSSRHRWAIWENGALFNQFCQPQYMGTDLRDAGQSMAMEYRSTAKTAPNFYGGWWFFAFPIDHAAHRPFPFFVRGDDVSFSLANDFNIVTLPGVVCSQDEDFSAKESPLTVYLDLRSHMVHHLALPSMDLGVRGTLKIPVFFFLRSLLQCQYETIMAQNLAFEDVLRGPSFFAQNADMAQRRAEIGKLRQDEQWKKLAGPVPAPRIRFDPHDPRTRLLMKLTINGHLLPFFGRYGNRLVLQADQRGHIRETWGAAQITYLNTSGQYFTVQHSKRAALREGWRFLRNALTFLRRYPQLKAEWQQGYTDLATAGFWEKRLGLQPGAPDAAE